MTMCHSYNEKFMKLAIEQAKKVELDIPVCSVIVKNNEIVSIATNKREENNSVISHAEILALKNANEKLKNWRLVDCDMYVTLEPCPMCAWAILNSRIRNVYFGSYDTQYGAFCSVLNLREYSSSDTKVFGGFLEEENNNILKAYFSKIRKGNIEKNSR